jgi:hypothetical protein
MRAGWSGIPGEGAGANEAQLPRGALILDPSLTLTPIMHGGGQERDIR